MNPVTMTISSPWKEECTKKKPQEKKKHSNKNTEKKPQSICKKYLSTYNKSSMASL